MYEETINGYRLSPQQERLWRLLAETQTPHPFRSACAAEVVGGLDVQRLARALTLACRRHESLRTGFEALPGLDLPLQVVGDEARPVSVRASEGGGDAETLLARLLDEELGAGGEGVRAAVAESSEGRTLLVLSAPAMCADAASMVNLLRELPALYAEAEGADAHDADAESDLVQYVQFSEWQHELLAEGVDEEAEDSAEVSPSDFWRDRLEGAAVAPALPFCAEPHTVASQAFAPRRVSLPLPGATRAALDSLASTLNVRPEAILFAAWQTWLCRLTGESQVLTHVSAGCRPFEEMAGAVGLYAKHLPLATNYREQETFAEAAAAAERALIEGHSRQEYYSPASAQEGVEGSTPAGLLGFAYEDWFADESMLTAGHGAASVSLRPLYANSISERFRLRLRVQRRGNALHLEFDYDSAEVSHESARRWAEGYEALLSAALSSANAPCRTLPALGESERSLLVGEWAGAGRAPHAAATAGLTLADSLRRAARLRGGEPAVVCGEDSLSFARLDADSDRLARLLRARGVGPGSVVALVMPRGVGAVLAAVAAWKAGAAYLPLDPEQPARRLRFMVEDSGASLVIASAETEWTARACSAPVLLIEEALAETAAYEATPLADDASPTDLAYVIYTSGSTGEPKGVMVERSSLLSLHASLLSEVYAPLAGDRPLRVSLNAPMYFDASVKQLVQLLSGHTLVVVPEELRRDPAALVAYARSQRVDVLDATPSLLRLLLDEGLCAGGARPLAVLSGGEAIDEALWARLAETPAVRFYNLYGPTECTVDATSRLVGAGERPTIGRPLANTRVYVLDGRGQVVPAGATGELYIGGAGVARGYLNRPSLTAEKFIPDPFSTEPGARLYRTGDLVRYLASGGLDYLGRSDRQVKLRGYRVELGEVEACLRRQPGVRDAAAVVRGEPGRERLVAYLAGRRGADPFAGLATHRLPDGRRVAHRNRNETEYLYEELFAKRSYFRHGVGLAEGAVVFDVGANIGMFTLLALDECPTARVHAFEPLGEIAACLRANARAHGRGRVRVYGHGLSDAERDEEFSYYPRYTMMSGERRYSDADSEVGVITRYLENEAAGGSLEAGELLANREGLLEGRFEERRERCRLRRLADVMREEGVGWVDLLKVDVQRAESDVLRGMDARAWARVGQVVMEVHDPAEGGRGRVRELKGELGALGFAAEAEQDELLEGTDRWNLYAVREDYAAARAAALASQAAAGEQPGEWRGEEEALTEWGVRAGLAQVLPEYMRPSDYVLLDSLPLTRNGKVDYRALPELEEIRARDVREYVAPRGELEQMIADVWRRLLRAEKVCVHENFFDAGGHSLLMAQFYHALRPSVVGEFTLLDLFKHPTISLLAKHLSGGRAERKEPEKIRDRVNKREEALRRQRRLMTERKAVNG